MSGHLYPAYACLCGWNAQTLLRIVTVDVIIRGGRGARYAAQKGNASSALAVTFSCFALSRGSMVELSIT